MVVAVLARAWHPGVVAEGRGARRPRGRRAHRRRADDDDLRERPAARAVAGRRGRDAARDARHAQRAVRGLQPRRHGGARVRTSCPYRRTVALTGCCCCPGSSPGCGRRPRRAAAGAGDGAAAGAGRDVHDRRRERAGRAPVAFGGARASSRFRCSSRRARCGRGVRRLEPRQWHRAQVVTVDATVFTTPGRPCRCPPTGRSRRAATGDHGRSAEAARPRPAVARGRPVRRYALFRVYDKTTGFADDYNWRDGVFAPPQPYKLGSTDLARSCSRSKRWRQTRPTRSCGDRDHPARGRRRRLAVDLISRDFTRRRAGPGRVPLGPRRHAPVPVDHRRQPGRHHRAALQLSRAPRSVLCAVRAVRDRSPARQCARPRPRPVTLPRYSAHPRPATVRSGAIRSRERSGV